jgi:hypothetical protein
LGRNHKAVAMMTTSAAMAPMSTTVNAGKSARKTLSMGSTLVVSNAVGTLNYGKNKQRNMSRKAAKRTQEMENEVLCG